MSCFSCLWMSTNLFDGHRMLANSLFIPLHLSPWLMVRIVNGRQTLMGIPFAIWHDSCVPFVVWLVTGWSQMISSRQFLLETYLLPTLSPNANLPINSYWRLTYCRLLTTLYRNSITFTENRWVMKCAVERDHSANIWRGFYHLRINSPNTINKKNIQFRRLLHLLHACSAMFAQWTLLIELLWTLADSVKFVSAQANSHTNSIRYGQQVAAFCCPCGCMWTPMF